MIRRVCPNCCHVWYSANTLPWPCHECGTQLDDRHNKPLIERLLSTGFIGKNSEFKTWLKQLKCSSDLDRLHEIAKREEEKHETINAET